MTVSESNETRRAKQPNSSVPQTTELGKIWGSPAAALLLFFFKGELKKKTQYKTT